MRVLIWDKAAITDVAFCRRCHLLLAALPKRRPYSTYDMRNSHMLRETATRPLRGGTPHPPTPLFIIPGLDSPAPICQNKLPFRPTVCQYINGVVMKRAPRFKLLERDQSSNSGVMTIATHVCSRFSLVERYSGFVKCSGVLKPYEFH